MSDIMNTKGLYTPPATRFMSQPPQPARLLNNPPIPSATTIAQRIQSYASSKQPTDLTTLSHLLKNFSTYGSKLLRLGRGSTPSITYDISLTPLFSDSLNDSSSSHSNSHSACAQKILLRHLSLYTLSTKTCTTATGIPLGRLLLNSIPTHWIIFVAHTNVLALRADRIAEEEVEQLCVVLHGANGLGECICAWRFRWRRGDGDTDTDAFGGEEALVLYLGDVGFLIAAQKGERRVLEWKVLRGVEAWTSVHVDADMDAEKEKGMKGLGC